MTTATSQRILTRLVTAVAIALAVTGCVGLPVGKPAESDTQASITPASESARDLAHLPPPKGKIVAAVYGFRDQTGQYKPAPDSSFSTAVTQGATSILLKSLRDSQWFVPVERENLQNLLTERKIVRALAGNGSTPPPPNAPPPLIPASIILEGGIVSYETNVKTGGAGARYLGIGASTIYRTDQVTVVLRAIDIRTGRILNSVSTTKAIYSHQIDLSVFKFVKYKHLLEMEAGYTRNEPAQMCVTDAIEAAVVHLVVQGLMDNSWALRNPADIKSPVVQTYLAEQRNLLFDSPRTQPVGNGAEPEAAPAIEQQPAEKTSRIAPVPAPSVLLETVGFAQLRGEQLEFRLHLSAPPPEPQVHASNAPAQLWLDFPNTGVRNGRRQVRVGRGPVVDMNAIQDTGRMRVVFRLNRPVTYVAAVDGNDYVLTIRWPKGDATGASRT